MHSVSNCEAYIVKWKDVQSAVQHSMDQGSFQKDVNAYLEIFSPKKLQISIFLWLSLCPIIFHKKRTESEIIFFYILKTIEILDLLQKYDFFIHILVHWAVDFNNFITQWSF